MRTDLISSRWENYNWVRTTKQNSLIYKQNFEPGFEYLHRISSLYALNASNLWKVNVIFNNSSLKRIWRGGIITVNNSNAKQLFPVIFKFWKWNCQWFAARLRSVLSSLMVFVFPSSHITFVCKYKNVTADSISVLFSYLEFPTEIIE
jgi:hypothetical protein